MDTHSSARQEPNDVEANATMTMRKKWGMSIVVFGLVGSVLSIATASWVQFAADGRLLCSQPACAQHPNALWVLCSVVTFVQCLLTLLAFSTAGRFTAPLSSLARAAERIGRGEPDVAVPVGGSMEVRTLGLAFQAILMELDASRAKAMQAQKLAAIGQRASGIAHEINNIAPRTRTKLYDRKAFSVSRYSFALFLLNTTANTSITIAISELLLLRDALQLGGCEGNVDTVFGSASAREVSNNVTTSTICVVSGALFMSCCFASNACSTS